MSKELKSTLNYEKKDVLSQIPKKDKAEVAQVAKEYLDFLNKSKTEYLCTEEIVRLLVKNGFKSIEKVQLPLSAGDKVYMVNKNKSVYAAVMGSADLKKGVNIIGAHIDSPRLDLKPMPLFESNGMAFFKTQYYGGIRKYQWLSIPLAMHGIIYNERGEKIRIDVGKEGDNFCFTITDLLPHLAYKNDDVPSSKFVDPENLNVLIGNDKLSNKEKEKVKYNILHILNKKYGIKEIDFARSEISLVPAFKAKYVGFDKSMIGGYGQDDRVCAFSTLRALIVSSNTLSTRTSIAMFVDKEEIGSKGNTSMSSSAFDLFIEKLGKRDEASINEVYYNSSMLSADVSSCLDPAYLEVYDVANSNVLGCGVSLMKYTGARGKSGASDANADYMSKVMRIFEKHEVPFQIGTLGKIERGGGGTIAHILADKGIDVVDCGTPVLSMHSPFEVTSKYDIYSTYLAYYHFFMELFEE